MKVSYFSKRINVFDTYNPSEFIKQRTLDNQKRIQQEKEALALKKIQAVNKSRLAILYNPETYSSDASVFINFIKDTYTVTNYTFVFYNGQNELVKALEENYKLGYRFFASPTIGSSALYNYCIPFCKKYTDVLLFTSYSTQYFEPGVLPYNIIRTSVNDKDMMKYLVSDYMYNVNLLYNPSFSLYFDPISSSTELDEEGKKLPVFSKIVYIYPEIDSNGVIDSFSQGYGEQLENQVNLENGKITVEIFKITDDDLSLPQRVKDLLSENPVSGTNFKTSKKTIFIINSYTPEKILNLFDEEYMYDNYFILGDTFGSEHFTSKYKFNYATSLIGNFSFDGYKISGILPSIEGQYLSPFLYALSDILLKILPLYSQRVNSFPLLSTSQLMPEFIDYLKNIEFIVNDNYFYERKVFVFYVDTKENDTTYAQYNEIMLFRYQFNLTIYGIST
jgi:hypothetical protein